MLPSSSSAVEKILEYTMVAADALQEVTILTQIPFLGQICTLTSTIIPMVQVQVLTETHMSAFNLDNRTPSFKRSDASGW
jgi:hypothetical protein